ncbi:hypothetical protein K439DRAFT_1336887 [Ramaria rubella]|nr:hypothetical protein K439DRAFT_1336887 [Ramaria rubella]
MFFYLSFLRPLPYSSDTGSHVSITPQIANDLRTSHLEEAVDIFYSWSPSLSDCMSSSANTTAQKLTTWRISSMYKNIPIPLPSNAKPSQEWRLSLSCVNSSMSFAIDLGARNFGQRPFPVVSIPIRIEGKEGKTKTSGKQEQIERLYSIPPSLDSGKQSTVLCIREQTTFELDKKIWDSGVGLSSWLTKLLLSIAPAPNLLMQHLKFLLTPSGSHSITVIELGTGTGIVSICLSALIGNVRADIYATDLPMTFSPVASAIELIEHNISTNKPAYPSVNLQASVLDWDDEGLALPVRGNIDLIVLADVTYNSASFPSLVRTLANLLQSSKASPEGATPCILLAYKQRDSAERELWSMLREININMVLVDKIGGASGEAIEIWIWKETLDDGSRVE